MSHDALLRLYQDFVRVLRIIQYFGYGLAGLVLLAALFSGQGGFLLAGSLLAIVLALAVYLSTQGIIAIVDLLSRIEANTRPSGSLRSLSPALPSSPSPVVASDEDLNNLNIPEMGSLPTPPDFFDGPLPTPPMPPTPAPPQPLTLLPLVFILASLEKKYQVRLVPTDHEQGVNIEIQLNDDKQDFLPVVREIREQLRTQGLSGKIFFRVLGATGQQRWENMVSV